jgi:hypothetical protein
MHQYALPSERGRECIGFVRLLRHTNPEDGALEGSHVQRILREELACYSVGMTTNMKRNFKFDNVSGNAYQDIMTKCVEEDYNVNCAVAA